MGLVVANENFRPAVTQWDPYDGRGIVTCQLDTGSNRPAHFDLVRVCFGGARGNLLASKQLTLDLQEYGRYGQVIAYEGDDFCRVLINGTGRGVIFPANTLATTAGLWIQQSNSSPLFTIPATGDHSLATSTKHTLSLIHI